MKDHLYWKTCAARFIKRALMAAFSLGCVALLDAEVLYQQNFDNALGRNLSLNRVAWQAYSAPDATDITGETSLVFIAHNPGNPASSGGFLAFVAPQGTYAAVGQIPAVDASGSTITWRMGNTHGTIGVRLLVRVGDAWFASETIFKKARYDAAAFSEAEPGSITQKFVFASGTGNWRRLVMETGNTLALGEPAELPSTTLKGIGFLTENTGYRAVVRIDSLLVEKLAP